MHRERLTFLKDWFHSTTRKPLVIRGARQVGKTWLVRQFAQLQKLQLIEINMEKNPHFEAFFASNDPNEILLNLGAALNIHIELKDSLLFIDEIQSSPSILSKLRWFAEELPQLAVIAAGSLLEFVLANHSFSMPVGRINYMHLEPLSFEEYLIANQQIYLRDYLQQYTWEQIIPLPLHLKLMGYFKEYLVIGGMPAAVSSWIRASSLQEINQIHFDLLATYRDDFTKYHGRLAIERLDEVMKAIPKQLRKRFVYSHVNAEIYSTTIKKALDLLMKAKIGTRVMSSNANGIPLGAETNEKYFKVVFLDVGLCSASLGFSLHKIKAVDEIILINNGAIAEQIVGQLLRTILPAYIEPELYYWQREQKGSNAEVDFLIQHKHEIIPVKVKAGKTGSLRSLHLFMELKKLPRAVRINSDVPSTTPIDVMSSLGSQVHYQLFSLPFYLIGQIHRLLT